MQNRKTTDLSKYNNSWYKTGAGFFKMTLWYFTNVLFFINPLNASSGIKVWLLKMFGARIGKGVVIKPGVSIKYPWKLKVGNYSWIGERAWIDNLDDITIGANCCISQGALLLCGNHDYRKTTFDLITRPIVLEDGVWIGAQSIVTGGVVCKSHSVLAAGSLASKDMEEYSVYRGNPAVRIKEREL